MTALYGRFTKQSTETLDYDVDYTDWFDGRADAPELHEAVAETGITLDSSAMTGKIIKILLSGGTDGEKYKITARMITNSGVVKEADFTVRIKDI